MNHTQKNITYIVGACLITIAMNISAMIMVSKNLGPHLTFLTIYFSILPGTLVGSFLAGYWLKSKGWLWGIVLTVIAMILASIFHSDKAGETILIYLFQIIPASFIAEVGSTISIKSNQRPETRD